MAAFLTAAGLQDAKPQRASSGVADSVERRRWVLGDVERRRWVLGDVIYDAVGVVESKYGGDDNCGLGLGMGKECAYEWLGLLH